MYTNFQYFLWNEEFKQSTGPHSWSWPGLSSETDDWKLLSFSENIADWIYILYCLWCLTWSVWEQDLVSLSSYFSRQYWLVWQYWQRVWIYMVWPASLFVVLLFLCTSPCSPSARLSACCRNQSFPENREKHHQAISYFELSPKAMIGKSSLSMIGKSYHHLIWNLDPKSMMGNLMFKIGNLEAIQWLESLTCSSSFSCWAFIFSWKTQRDTSKNFQICENASKRFQICENIETKGFKYVKILK